MGSVEANQLKYFCEKIGNDPDLLAEDAYGKKIPLDANPRPKAFRTFCNVLVQRVCRAMGYDALDGMNANQMFKYLEKNWFPATEEEARDAACIGDLVIAAWYNPDPPPHNHGHVAIVFPQKLMIFSGKWNVECPFVAAVDKPIPTSANYSFSVRPRYFKLGRVTS